MCNTTFLTSYVYELILHTWAINGAHIAPKRLTAEHSEMPKALTDVGYTYVYMYNGKTESSKLA